jgi:FtsP/CotA-like multicopper oxidase with cupredoxin domain
MSSHHDRREFLAGISLVAGGLAAGVDLPDHAMAVSPKDRDKRFPRLCPGLGGPIGSASDRGKLTPGYRSPHEPPVPVECPDIPKLPFQVKNGVKEFQLTAQHVEREILPDKWIDFWGYNGSMPGPTIEANQGDRVRIVLHNKLPESTTVHWHGLELPNAMDGADYVTQEPIRPGQMFIYEFDLHQNGTFFYHSHGPMQEAIGMIGLFLIHPKNAHEPAVDRDFALMVQEFSVLAKSTVPDTMSDSFNFFTLNGRAAPFVTPLVVKLGERVRIRFVNLSTMDHHPMHLHGHTFWVTGTEGGRVPESAWIPGNTVLVGVGQARDVEFIANNAGDWKLHCHIPHHMMNHMVPPVGPDGDAIAATPGPGQDGSVKVDNRWNVPGYPKDMMDMKSMFDADQVKRISSRLTHGMRKEWFRGPMGMTSVLRVLPPELYDKVISGKGEVAAGASVPGAESSKSGHKH